MSAGGISPCTTTVTVRNNMGIYTGKKEPYGGPEFQPGTSHSSSGAGRVHNEKSEGKGLTLGSPREAKSRGKEYSKGGGLKGKKKNAKTSCITSKKK